MIRAVFFDWSGTLARYVPTREELQSQALRELGISISPQDIAPGLAIADRYLFKESAASPMRFRSPAEQAKVNIRYQQMVYTRAGVKIPDSDTFLKLMRKLAELSTRLRFVPFNDVLPAFKALKDQNLILALVTNMDADMSAV